MHGTSVQLVSLQQIVLGLVLVITITRYLSVSGKWWP
jgi:hypothetical protein